MLKVLVSFGDFHMLGYMFTMFGYSQMSVFPVGIYGGMGVSMCIRKLSNLDLWSSKLNGQALLFRSNPVMVSAGTLIGN